MIEMDRATRTLTYREAINEALVYEMERDPNIFIMGEDIGAYGGQYRVTVGLQERFGVERVRDTPISEAGFIGAAIGSAMSGKRPIVELMFADFALVAADQLFNQAAKMRYLSGNQFTVPLTIRTQHGVAPGVGPQHSQCLEALFMHIPGFAVALPSSPADAKGLLTTAIRSNDPAIVIEHKALYATKGTVPEGEHLVAFGEAAIRRTGGDVTLVSYSRAVDIALSAAQELAAQGIEAEVIDLRTIVPLDWNTVLASAKKTGRVVVVHEAYRRGGAGAEIAAQLTERSWGSLRAPVLRVGGLDIPVPYAGSLETVWMPQPSHVIEAVRRTLQA